MNGMLDLVDDDQWYFDEEAGERPCRFVERYCRHYEGAHAGKPFILHPLQRRIVRDLFGWKSRATRLRRFNVCYFEGAVGCGKSPLLAAIGLYGLMADGERGAQVYSLASDYTQARVVFECAKKMIHYHPALEDRLDPLQYEINHPESDSFWRLVSGDGPGAGCRPSLVLGDEVHDWAGPGAYQDLFDRMSKRRQPLMLVATNAGESRASFCWQLRERATAALAGHGDPQLYPVIWAADNEEADNYDADAWRQANPLIGVTMQEDKIRAKFDAAGDDRDELARLRRLYLGIWPKSGAGRWLDLGLYDGRVSDDTMPADAPLYTGLDMAESDDLCAAVHVGVTPETFYVEPHFWLPRETAEIYQKKDGIPYEEWAAAGWITLLDETTISAAVRVRIAKLIIARHQRQKLKGVYYDPARAEETIAELTAAGINCMPIQQGYSISPGCFQLERRIKERSITFNRNPVLRFCAENCEVTADRRGNIWPVKPNARGKYAGTRSAKIDGIVALVTALTEARKHAFPKSTKKWAGPIVLKKR